MIDDHPQSADSKQWEEEMLYGLYGSNSHVTVGSKEVAEAAARAMHPLAAGSCDKQFEFGQQILREADAVGFDIVLFAERHLGCDLTTWPVAGAIGSRLEHIRTMVAVHPGLWHPALIAKMAVSLDRICKNGMAINIVAGASEAEFQMFGGTALIGSDDRYARTIEFIDVLRGMWRGEPFSYEGKFYQVKEAELRLAPRSDRTPEIFTAAGSDSGRDMVARSGDWWFVDFSRQAASRDEMLASIESSIKDMRSRMRRTGRKVRFAFNPFLSLGNTEAEALEQAVQRMTRYDSEPDSAKVRNRMMPATLGGCIGSPSEVRKQVQRLADMGIELLLFKMPAGVADIRLAGEEIIQQLRRERLDPEAA